ncbi:hypothetical protein PAPYR_6799 [Paratrimastix pyriformis]|uniref:Uncharacterized protein n=1 Tax=Paratrimastix pyriformis TaxID=342808 RepID=A0ABQ8UEF0_9EUKA|nr:hypothetical protein PAPYR_6799 [Paratrimastix pyriformis]
MQNFHKTVAWGPYTKPIPESVRRARKSYSPGGPPQSAWGKVDQYHYFQDVYREDLEQRALKTVERRAEAERLERSHHRSLLQAQATIEKKKLTDRMVSRQKFEEQLGHPYQTRRLSPTRRAPSPPPVPPLLVKDWHYFNEGGTPEKRHQWNRLDLARPTTLYCISRPHLDDWATAQAQLRQEEEARAALDEIERVNSRREELRGTFTQRRRMREQMERYVGIPTAAPATRSARSAPPCMDEEALLPTPGGHDLMGIQPPGDEGEAEAEAEAWAARAPPPPSGGRRRGPGGEHSTSPPALGAIRLSTSYSSAPSTPRAAAGPTPPPPQPPPAAHPYHYPGGGDLPRTTSTSSLPPPQYPPRPPSGHTTATTTAPTTTTATALPANRTQSQSLLPPLQRIASARASARRSCRPRPRWASHSPPRGRPRMSSTGAIQRPAILAPCSARAADPTSRAALGASTGTSPLPQVTSSRSQGHHPVGPAAAASGQLQMAAEIGTAPGFRVAPRQQQPAAAPGRAPAFQQLPGPKNALPLVSYPTIPGIIPRQEVVYSLRLSTQDVLGGGADEGAMDTDEAAALLAEFGMGEGDGEATAQVEAIRPQPTPTPPPEAAPRDGRRSVRPATTGYGGSGQLGPLGARFHLHRTVDAVAAALGTRYQGNWFSSSPRPDTVERMFTGTPPPPSVRSDRRSPRRPEEIREEEGQAREDLADFDRRLRMAGAAAPDSDDD